MRRIKKTKIIATLGPSSSSRDNIEMLIKEGADVLRINFSHSTHKEAKLLINEIRKINEELNTNTSILADLQGPKLRIGEIKASTSLCDGDKIEFETGKEFVGDKNKIYVIKANGLVEKANRNIFTRDINLEPGDSIIVPRKIITNNPGIEALIPITQVLSNFAFSAAAIESLTNSN